MVPALAVADALRAEGAEVVFVGGERAEAVLVPQAGYELRSIRVEGISRSNPMHASRALLRVPAALRAARGILRDVRPDAVMGGGGYVSGPVGLAAVLARIPLVLTEADSHLGLANRALAPFAKRVCLAFPIHGRSGSKYLVTGRPVPPPFTDRAAARAKYGLGERETMVLVFGGSLGARSINQAAIEAYRDAPFRVLHAAGERDIAKLASPGDHYRLEAFIAPFGEALAASDLVVARSGGSIFEIAAARPPRDPDPVPARDRRPPDHERPLDGRRGRRGDHPRRRAHAPSGCAPRRAGSSATRRGCSAMARSSAELARPDAARDVAAELLAAAEGRKPRH